MIAAQGKRENTSQTIVMLLHKLVKVFEIHCIEGFGLKSQHRKLWPKYVRMYCVFPYLEDKYFANSVKMHEVKLI